MLGTNPRATCTLGKALYQLSYTPCCLKYILKKPTRLAHETAQQKKRHLLPRLPGFCPSDIYDRIDSYKLSSGLPHTPWHLLATTPPHPATHTHTLNTHGHISTIKKITAHCLLLLNSIKNCFSRNRSPLHYSGTILTSTR